MYGTVQIQFRKQEYESNMALSLKELYMSERVE